MKKITFVLFALIAGTAFGQKSASANVTADIVSPITIIKATDFNFGKVANTGGTVVITTQGYDEGQSTTPQIGTTFPTAAAFTVNAAAGYGYVITLPKNKEIQLINQTGSGEETMKVTGLNHNSDQKGDGADETFQLGGILEVATGQTVGNYTGKVEVSVAYE